MGETTGALLFLLSGLAVLWGVAGLFRPRLVLWWAVPEKQTRKRAVGFGFFIALTLFFSAIALIPGAKWWVWGFVVMGLLLLFVMGSSFRMTAKELQALVRQQEYAKKAGVTQTVYSLTSDKEYEIRPFVARCSCPDWEERRMGASGPFRVCKHLSRHYALHQDDLPDELKRYADLIAHFGYEDKGVPPQGEFYMYGIEDDMAYLMTGYADSLPWVNIYTDFSTERYGFNLETGRWAKGKEPPFAKKLAEGAQNRAKKLLG